MFGKLVSSKQKVLKFVCLGISMFVLMLALFYGVRATYSALTDHDQKQNDFQIGNLKSSIEEDFTPPSSFEPDIDYTKRVSIKNTGGLESFIRVLATPVITVETDEGVDALLPATTNGDKAVLTVDYNLTEWIDGKDGYFYYKKKLMQNEDTAPLFSKVRMNKENISDEYKSAKMTFEIKVEGIHTTKFAYRDAWWNSEIPILESPLYKVDEVLSSQTT
ncbi:hypothetical protein [Enterococcus wangshanyuanii]|uniref:Alternate signal-mediated exported protein, CPF_0494 family n=1 Tax=Enterococcus wangshanyuanii TaxID=2005703 RepID=A0ABQ1PTF5_9ENTE|nr:hypothetical protein [Enterococcus wangshanyuanii]GGD02993.1 hypothetical protein GCM10011573_35580 [Enterococcus wangshanyuanii]